MSSPKTRSSNRPRYEESRRRTRDAAVGIPPRPPDDGFHDPSVLERLREQQALIEEARRRARRRRQAYAAAALLAAAAGTAAFLSFHHGGGGGGKPAVGSESPIGAISRVGSSVSPMARGGQLTILARRPGVSSSGWYEIYTLARGRLHPFIRCPDRAEWCGEVTSVAWLRDGSRLAFSVTSLGGPARFNGIHIVDLRTGQDRWQSAVAPDYPVDLEWSPDGSRLTFASAGFIYVMDVKSFRARLVPTWSSGFDSSPSWSPRGTSLVFANRQNHQASIYRVDLDGSHRQLLASGASAPAWSPDGTKIAYRSSCGGGIRLITPAGKDVTPGRSHSHCKTIGFAGSPVWSPDGKKIAIIAARAFTPGTYVMDVAGGHLAFLTSADGRAQSYVRTEDASWQPLLPRRSKRLCWRHRASWCSRVLQTRKPPRTSSHGRKSD
jgi:WD40-like Beta Propeller Repeat